MRRWGRFIAKDPVLACAVLAFLLTLPFALPSLAPADYLAGIDVRTLAMLWCLLVVVGGLRQRGIMRAAGLLLARRARTTRTLAIALVLLAFFWSMLITNDVALLVFIPLALTLLSELGQRPQAAAIVVLVTAAANIGSSLSPLGNPQNIFLQSYFDLGLGTFVGTMLPVAAAGLALLLAGCLLLVPAQPLGAAGRQPAQAWPLKAGEVAECAVLFALLLLALLCAARVVGFTWLLGATALTALCRFRREARQADYALLGTFVAFFLFVVNVQHIPAVQGALESLLGISALATSALVSQVISNVPAAITLAGFTGDAAGLLLGCNIGGLGTPIASLASLIALKFYRAWNPTGFGTCLRLFALVNATGFIILLTGALLLA